MPKEVIKSNEIYGLEIVKRSLTFIFLICVMKWKHKDLIIRINYKELGIVSPSLRVADFHLGQIKYRSVLARSQGIFFGVGRPGETYITLYQVKKFDSETLFYNTIKFVLNLESYEMEDREN